VSLLPIQVLLTAVASLPTRNREALSQALRAVRWRSRSSVYRTGLAPYAVETLEWLQERIDFEIGVSGTPVSPLWYQTELLALAESRQQDQVIKCIVGNYDALYDGWEKQCGGAEHLAVLSTVLSRHVEFLDKLQTHLSALTGAFQALKSAAVLKDLRWPDLDAHALGESLHGKETALLENVAKASVSLHGWSRPPELPDYRGQSVHLIGRKLHEAMRSQQEERLRCLFPAFFFCMLDKSNADRGTIDTTGPMLLHRLQHWIAPIDDLCDLSGYALIYSEYHGDTRLWDIVRAVWDSYLGDKGVLERFCAILSIPKPLSLLRERDILMTHRKMALGQDLRGLPRDVVERGTIVQATVCKAPERPDTGAGL
jgi:hypothetical protein